MNTYWNPPIPTPPAFPEVGDYVNLKDWSGIAPDWNYSRDRLVARVVWTRPGFTNNVRFVVSFGTDAPSGEVYRRHIRDLAPLTDTQIESVTRRQSLVASDIE